jgi:hypothetical protein
MDTARLEQTNFITRPIVISSALCKNNAAENDTGFSNRAVLLKLTNQQAKITITYVIGLNYIFSLPHFGYGMFK